MMPRKKAPSCQKSFDEKRKISGQNVTTGLANSTTHSVYRPGAFSGGTTKRKVIGSIEGKHT